MTDLLLYRIFRKSSSHIISITDERAKDRDYRALL